MGSLTIPDLLAILLFVVTAFIAIRALYLYARIRSPRLFVLGLAMVVIALTALADLSSAHITAITLHTNWFLYIGQAVSFLFILLSLINNDDDYQRNLMRWHIFFSLAALALLALSPLLPEVPNETLQAILQGTRSLFCFMIFFYYAAAFMSKQSRFSLLMTIAFFFLSFGYLMILMQHALGVDQALFDHIGDFTRMAGLVALLFAVIIG